jgi:hypothetical protein
MSAERFDPARMYDALKPFMEAVDAEILAAPEGLERDLLHKLHSEIHDAVMTGYLLAKFRRPAPVVEQFRCGFVFSDGVVCGAVAKQVDPTGVRWCAFHAPTDVDLTITEHDDQRDNR